jgi:DNA-binding transcriptional MocR family regulator
MTGDPTARRTADPAVVARLSAATTQAWGGAGVIDLGVGQPHASLLPAHLFDRAAASGPWRDRLSLQYGVEAGDGGFRLALAEFLTEAYDDDVDPELTFVTNGNSHAIDLVCSMLTEPGAVVFVEEPTYFLALHIFRHHRLEVVGIPVDEDGLSIDALEAELSRGRPAFVYTMPAFQNPTGVTLSPSRRERLVALAQEHGFLVVADEVYQLLRYSGPSVPPLATRIDSGVVLSLGTFSKILAPGLRLGWIQGARPLLDRLVAAPAIVSGGGLNPFSAAIVRAVLSSGDQLDHLEHLRAEFRHRVELVDRTIRDHFPATVEYSVPEGGYFFWLRFPAGTRVTEWEPPARLAGVGFRSGSLFSASGALDDRMRLSFAFYERAELVLGLERLGSVLR